MSNKIYRVRGGCVLCMTCQTVCPANAIRINGDSVRIDEQACRGCGQCLANCPGEAIEVVDVSADPHQQGDEGHG